MKCTFLVLLIPVSNLLWSQPGWKVYNSTNSTLKADYYNSITIDKSGNIWVGSLLSGVFKFNGTTWTNYRTLNSNILHNDINDIVVDNANKVWVATFKGISVFNGTTFTSYTPANAGFTGSEVYALGKDNNGIIWLSSEDGSGYKGITTFDGTTWKNLTGYPSQINGKEFPDFTFSAQNVAWIAGNGITRYDGTFSFYPYASTKLWSSNCLATDDGGNIWAGGFDGLLKYDGSKWTFIDNVADFGFTSNTQYLDIFPDGDILWVATSKGLLKLDRLTLTLLANYNSANSPLADNDVTGIVKDTKGKIWLSTRTGVVKMDLTGAGIDDEVIGQAINISPNPSQDIFDLSFQTAGKHKYKVSTIEGKSILSGEITSDFVQIDLSDVPAGMYLMYSETGNKINQPVKIIKY
jgi:ligand-binding sensor domain-containing protein